MSEFGDRGSGIGGRDRLDTAIDLAVREMLDVEPPAGLRGRVLDRIESPRRGFTWIWIASPMAAAAIIVLAVLLPSTTDRTPVAPVAKGGPDHRLAVTHPVAQAPQVSQPRTPAATAQTVTRTPRPSRALAAMAPDEAAADVVWIDALIPPDAMAVAAIEPGRGTAIKPIDLAPAQITALEVRPITDTPQERRNQE